MACACTVGRGERLGRSPDNGCHLCALTFIAFILLDVLFQRWQERRVGHAERPAARPWLSASDREKLAGWISVPEGVYVSDGHAWAQTQPEGTVRAGVDGLVSRVLGDVSEVILPEVDDELATNDPLFHLELNRRVLTVNSSVSGRVVAVNRRLQERPGLVADDPFGDGWVCSVAPMRRVQENGATRLGDRAAEWLKQQVGRLRESISTRLTHDLALGLTSQDGGAPAIGCVARPDAKAWIDFEREFLRLRYDSLARLRTAAE